MILVRVYFVKLLKIVVLLIQIVFLYLLLKVVFVVAQAAVTRSILCFIKKLL